MWKIWNQNALKNKVIKIPYKLDFLFSLGLYIKLEILKEAKELLNNTGSISDMQNWIRERELEFRTRIKQLKQKWKTHIQLYLPHKHT